LEGPALIADQLNLSHNVPDSSASAEKKWESDEFDAWRCIESHPELAMFPCEELTAAGFTATDQTYCSTLRAYCLAKDAKNVEAPCFFFHQKQ